MNRRTKLGGRRGARFAVLAIAVLVGATSLAANVRISGKVTDADGRPIEGAEVYIETRAIDTSITARAETNVKGKYVTLIGHPSSAYLFRVTKEGYAPAEELFELGLGGTDRGKPVRRNFVLTVAAHAGEAAARAADDGGKLLVPLVVDLRELAGSGPKALAKAFGKPTAGPDEAGFYEYESGRVEAGFEEDRIVTLLISELPQVPFSNGGLIAFGLNVGEPGWQSELFVNWIDLVIDGVAEGRVFPDDTGAVDAIEVEFLYPAD